MERQLVVKLKKKYGESLPLIKVKGDNEIYDCYIGVISGELLARIYETEAVSYTHLDVYKRQCV